MAKKRNAHYVNNADFSQAVVDYVTIADAAKADGKEPPIIPDYIAQSFLRISEGLSHKANFIRYTYREEMVMDAVENCLKAIGNYDLAAATRTGKPNAFAYFTQIAWYAFLRRIAKEKKQQDIKLEYLNKSGLESFIDNEMGDKATEQVVTTFIEGLRGRIEKVKTADEQFTEYTKERKKRTVTADSDLSEFMK